MKKREATEIHRSLYSLIVRDRYNIPDHIPEEQVDKYIDEKERRKVSLL